MVPVDGMVTPRGPGPGILGDKSAVAKYATQTT